MESIPDGILLASISGVVLALLKVMHGQVISKLEEVVKSNGNIREYIAIHSTKLEQASDQFAIIREHQRIQDEKINTIEKDLMQLVSH